MLPTSCSGALIVRAALTCATLIAGAELLWRTCEAQGRASEDKRSCCSGGRNHGRVEVLNVHNWQAYRELRDRFGCKSVVDRAAAR